MISPQAILDYVKAEPFRPFRLYMASGRAFDVRHPEMIKVLKNSVLVFRVDSETQEIPEDFERVSLMLTESVAPIVSVHP